MEHSPGLGCAAPQGAGSLEEGDRLLTVDTPNLQQDSVPLGAAWPTVRAPVSLALVTTMIFGIIYAYHHIQVENASAMLHGHSNPDFVEMYTKDYACDRKEWAAFLKKFNVYDSGKGTIVDWNTFRDREQCRDNNVVWFWPSDDHNDAFQINKKACYRLMHWHSRACSVTVVHTKSVEHAMTVLDDFPDESLKQAVLGGHSNPNSMHWGDCESGSVRSGVTCTAKTAATIFESATSSYTNGKLTAGDKVVTTGRQRVVDGFTMLPIKRGAVERKNVYCQGDKTCKLSSDMVSVNFLKKLSQKLHRDTSLLMDGCSVGGRPEGGGDNLAQFTAKTVGKGIRVFAIGESLYTTDVQRWIPFYATLNDKAPLVAVTGAQCPDWSASEAVTRTGDCRCKGGSTCVSMKVEAGKTRCVVKADVTIYASITSWSKIGALKKGDTVVASGRPGMAEGYFMLPIQPEGAVSVPRLDCDVTQDCPKSMGQWSKTKFLPVCSDAWAPTQCGCI
jgi:hypothetical protein